MDEAASISQVAAPHVTHPVRITDHTKIKQYVSFCLKSLTENPYTTLMLHTLPNPDTQSSTKQADEGQEPKTKKRKLASSTRDISRLISIAEIVKREFAALVKANKAGSSGSPGAVLYQYNVIDCFESPQEEQDPILLALEGKNYPKRSTVSYMKIYLSTQVREDLEKEGATYQAPPPPPKKSKAARAREKKRLLKQKKAMEITEEGPTE